MGRNIAAGIVGIVVAGLLIVVVEKIGHMVYPLPEGLDVSDMEAFAAHVASLPVGALLFVGAAWMIGAAAGTCAACAIGTASPLRFAIVIGGLVFVGACYNMFMIPHPAWFSIVALIGIVVGATLGTMCKRATANNAE